MSTETWINVVSTGVSLGALGTTIIFSRKARRNANEANKVAIGQAETMLRNSISAARGRLSDSMQRLMEFLKGRKAEDLDENEQQVVEFLRRTYRTEIEDLLNAYEDACGKYRDHKIDKERFKKMYVREIENLCIPDSQGFSEFMHPEGTSKFQAIWKVYHEWHSYEK